MSTPAKTLKARGSDALSALDYSAPITNTDTRERPLAFDDVATTSRGDPGANAMAKLLKLLLSPPPPPIERPRISEELAGCFDAADGGRALVVSPFGKIWRVEIERDGEGAFLGRGWAEFLAAHGIDAGWFVVLRHEGGGALTVKAFDARLCIREFGVPVVDMAKKNSKGISCKPQFISVMHQDSMEKMMIPVNFVKQYVICEYLNSPMAVVVSPLGKFWRVKVENDESGMFFSGGWSNFLAFHGISEGDILFMRYEGNMVFKFKAFDLHGSLKDFNDQGTRIKQNIGRQQEGHFCCPTRKREGNSENPSCEENKRSKGSTITLKKASTQKEPDYQAGPPSWIKKEITNSRLKHTMSLSSKFCSYIGFQKSCTITLKTNMDSTRSWKVHGLAYNNVRYLGDGWKTFCQENRLKEGDVCTFNIVKTMLWQVTIMRSSTDNQMQQKSTPAHSDMECMNKNDSSSIEELKGPNGSRTTLKKASYTRSVYEIGPPSWIQKEMTTASLQKHLYLAPAFFVGIGLRVPSVITLKTFIHSSKSWQVHVVKKMNGSYQLGQDWWMFCQDNRLKEGDICTFKVVETKLWQVVITRG